MTKRSRLILYATLLCTFCLLFPCMLVSQTKEVLYVGAFNGLDLRESGNHTAKIIKTLPQYTKLLVLEKEQNPYAGTYNRWYKVQAGSETGWVLSAYLTARASADTPNPRKPVFLTESSILLFPDSMVIHIKHNGFYSYTIDAIKAYDSPDKKSGFSEITQAGVRLYRVPENEEWLYLIKMSQGLDRDGQIVLDWKNQGFISVYDLPKKSFSGYYDNNPEYTLIQKYPAIFKRHGPLLEVTWNNKPIRFWDSTSQGDGTHTYTLVDYYKDYDEILLYEGFYEGSSYGLYSLRQGKGVCGFGSKHGLPNFNKSRNAVFSLSGSLYGGRDYLSVFLIKNGGYTFVKIKNAAAAADGTSAIVVGDWVRENEQVIHWGAIYTIIKDARWIDDNALQITYTDENKKEDFILLIQRKDADSDFEVVRNK